MEMEIEENKFMEAERNIDIIEKMKKGKIWIKHKPRKCYIQAKERGINEVLSQDRIEYIKNKFALEIKEEGILT